MLPFSMRITLSTVTIVALLAGCGNIQPPRIQAITSSGDENQITACALRDDGTVSCTCTGNICPDPISTFASTLTHVTALSVHNELCAVIDDGSVTCSADGHFPFTDAIAVAASTGGPSCALHRSGQVSCWDPVDVDNPSGVDGELGDGTNQWSTSPQTVVGVSNATAIGVGNWFACAVVNVANASTVACWGDDWGVGDLGDGATMTVATTPIPIGGILVNVTSVAVGDAHACALRADGTVACWGMFMPTWELNLVRSTSTTPVAVDGVTDAIAIAAAGDTTCALRKDQTVVCWGENSYGECGDGTTKETLTVHAPVPIPGATAISPSCALTNDSTDVWCWGGWQSPSPLTPTIMTL